MKQYHEHNTDHDLDYELSLQKKLLKSMTLMTDMMALADFKDPKNDWVFSIYEKSGSLSLCTKQLRIAKEDSQLIINEDGHVGEIGYKAEIIFTGFLNSISVGVMNEDGKFIRTSKVIEIGSGITGDELEKLRKLFYEVQVDIGILNPLIHPLDFGNGIEVDE